MSAFQIEGFTTDAAPALVAGLQIGDIITELNGKELNSVEEVVAEISQSNGSYSLEFFRNGKTTTINIEAERLGCALVSQAIPVSVQMAKAPKVDVSTREQSLKTGNLVECSVCGEHISRNAKSCPHCGEQQADEKKKEAAKKLLIISLSTLIFTVVLSLVIFSSSSTENGTASSQCVSKGIKYYKSIGRYPTLSTGESAYRKAVSLCSHSNNAFNNF